MRFKATLSVMIGESLTWEEHGHWCVTSVASFTRSGRPQALFSLTERSVIAFVLATELTPILAAWAPYFDNMNAIIFLAPISCFDQVCCGISSIQSVAFMHSIQVLFEDTNVNRLVSNSMQGCCV